MSNTDAAGWHRTSWFRSVLSDGTVWAESSDEQEMRERWEQIRRQTVTVYPPSGEKTYGPDPDARLEHLWERHQYDWRKCGVHDNCKPVTGRPTDPTGALDLYLRVKAFCQDCVANGDMNPIAEQMLLKILTDWGRLEGPWESDR